MKGVSLNFQRYRESYKCLPITKITIKREFIREPKHINSIINVYAPTSQVRDDVYVFENFYKDVSTAFNQLKSKSLVSLTGDRNANVGKKIKQHASDNCVGSLVRDVGNNSGQHLLLDFCAINNLFISNIVFQQKVTHITIEKTKDLILKI